jgi:chaperonin GroES
VVFGKRTASKFVILLRFKKFVLLMKTVTLVSFVEEIIGTLPLTVPNMRLNYIREPEIREKELWHMIKPLNDNLLIEKVPNEKKVGSIVLTSEKKTGNLATVVALGPGKTLESGKLVKIEGVKVGDKVIYREYAGTDYEDGDHKYLIIKAEDILAVVD